MNDETIGGIISGIAIVAAAIISKTDLFFGKQYGYIIKQLQIYNALPEESSSKDRLIAKIDENIDNLINKTSLRRDGVGVALAIVFISGGAYLTWFFAHKGSWWLIGIGVSVFMLILGLVGFVQDISRLERDENGRPVKNTKK